MMPTRVTQTRSRTRIRRWRIGGVAIVIAIATSAHIALASTDAPGASGQAIVAEDYDLGIRQFRQPGLNGKFAQMPIRLWGTIAAPASPGKRPVVLVAHGAHGDNCPGEYGTWPCFAREQRNDLGLRYLVRALARAGFVAFAPDLNASHTGGWGELANGEALRFGQILDATLTELGRAGRKTSTRFRIGLGGKPDLTQLGVLGHSRGGMNVLAWGRGKPAVKSVFLLAPLHDPKQKLADVSATVLLGRCDGDTRLEGTKYVAALRGTRRTKPVYQVTLGGANHNFYNQTLVQLRADDVVASHASCSAGRRLSASQQQSFLVRVATDHFAVSLRYARPAVWMTGKTDGQLYGRAVEVKRAP